MTLVILLAVSASAFAVASLLKTRRIRELEEQLHDKGWELEKARRR